MCGLNRLSPANPDRVYYLVFWISCNGSPWTISKSAIAATQRTDGIEPHDASGITGRRGQCLQWRQAGLDYQFELDMLEITLPAS